MSELQEKHGVEINIEYLFCKREGQKDSFRKNHLLIGSGKECEIRIDEKGIAAKHCQIIRQNDILSLTPLEKQSVWVNGKSIRETIALKAGDIVSLKRAMGPGFRLEGATDSMQLSEKLREMRNFRASMIANASRAASEKPFQRKVVNRWFNRLNKNYKKRIVIITVVTSVLLAFGGAYLFHQQAKLNRLNLLASDLFYQMKEIELQVFRTEDVYAVTGDSLSKQMSKELWNKYRRMERKYEEYLEELGFHEGMTEKERIILRMARVFGECELNIPNGFVENINDYINRWRSTPRYANAITRAIEEGYAKHITDELVRNHLPPHFFYLAMQESDFDKYTCGPRTRYGIAKGMWQFIPTTAVHFGLKLGPLVEVRKPDPRDERHDFKKSTKAASKYLRFLYQTEAQASGLLVMASYNWGEGKILRLLSKMPPNPRDRNFWRLVNEFEFPRETQSYVYYIFSAAVIGENPELFGFDMEKPLAQISH